MSGNLAGAGHTVPLDLIWISLKQCACFAGSTLCSHYREALLVLGTTNCDSHQAKDQDPPSTSDSNYIIIIKQYAISSSNNMY